MFGPLPEFNSDNLKNSGFFVLYQTRRFGVSYKKLSSFFEDS